MRQLHQFDGRTLLVLKTALDNYQRHQANDPELAKPWLYVVETLLDPISNLDIWAIRKEIYEEDERRSRRATMRVVSQGDWDVISTLTERELEVLRLIGQGHQNQSIADLLNISLRTLTNHKTHIMAKLKLGSVKDIPKFAVNNMEQLR
ncbi:LuxR C-terminal-related transcriptional regulator [Spirosoma terrae]|uniref:HTH luxR-type domain-containing protein n=1 Tax=Spirosoma terrae TaxID=1968276 RepID=A0A6L9LKL5_9BACT|nr:LuxR family transcriptional regulator [Spirosoma terrae]NDU97209.1 hypothetical protein [Spirosoma terrae]